MKRTLKGNLNGEIKDTNAPIQVSLSVLCPSCNQSCFADEKEAKEFLDS